jgi:acyl-coenzyme A synthetase/AMP-(fatty) acid ligase
MKMPRNSPPSLFSALSAVGDLSSRFVFGVNDTLAWSCLLEGSVLDSRGDELRDRSVLIATKDQLTALWALMELDGIAGRVVLYPPDLPLEHLAYVIEAAAVDVLVSDRLKVGQFVPRVRYFTPCSCTVTPVTYERGVPIQTEWILLTSGTTGPPKLVVHTLASLSGAISQSSASKDPVIWSTFYDIRRYGGLQILLRAALTGASLVLPGADEPTGDFLARAAAHRITHISGTPSHWRQVLMNSAARLIAPEYIRLSGEIADQGILNHLRSAYPQARIAHAFASTEAGVAFEVNDGLAGFSVKAIEETPGIEMKVEGGSLRIRSDRTATCYLGDQSPSLRGPDGFVDTRDLLELRDGRYHFVGRQDGMINVGGLKVHPEEVESVINRHPEVQMSLVRAKRNPITGSLVVADVVLNAVPRATGESVDQLEREILLLCREALSSHKVPAVINVVHDLAVAESGKLVRIHA